jgi:hypothetical protein
MWGADAGANPHGKGRVIHGMSAREWLESQATGADFTSMDAALIESLDFIHRRTADRDIYFVRNKTGQPLGADCRFRVSGRTPQFWDPATGDITGAPGFQPVDGGTRVRLDLPPGGSIFVVFSDHPVPAASSADRDVAGNPASHLLDGGWTVAFDPTWGAPARVELPALISWTDHPDAGVKYYSGTGTYTRTLEVPADWPGEGRRVWLDLGEVGELAEVFVNGRSAGILWKPPFQADITALVRPGANDLKIEVMNLWVNRLIGDESLPPEQRLTRTNIRLGDGSRQRLGWELQPSGLLGPVRLLAAPAAPRSP